MSSVLTELRERVFYPPPTTVDGPDKAKKRLSAVQECIRVLDDRGLDGEAVLRRGLGGELAQVIILSSFIPEVVAHLAQSEGSKSGGLDDIEGAHLTRFRPWRELVELISVPYRPSYETLDWSEQLGYALSNDPSARIAVWISEAPVEDVVMWRPPSPEALTSIAFDARLRDTPERWVVDRFTGTYLGAWETSSLHMEFEYQLGNRVGPCSSVFMRERRIAMGDLQAEIADRAVRGRGRRDRARSKSYTYLALDHLRVGDRSTAAQIFELARKMDPDDEVALNNYGFCLVIDDPERALVALEEAAAMGYDLEPVNVGNRMLVLRMLDRPTSALALAERLVENWKSTSPSGGWMWDVEAAARREFKLVSLLDVRRYVMDLAVLIAGDCDDKLRQRWETQRGRLFPDGNASSADS